MKEEGRNKEYDCIAGVSGGLDSSYALYKVKNLGLRPLAVHLDNGWNSELAVSNIEKLCGGLKVDLFTQVIDWDEFRDLQRSFFKAKVIDIELLTDHAIVSLLYKVASRRRVKYLLAGTNFNNEGMRIPPSWNHFKLDARNILAIHKKFGNGKRIKTFPLMGLAEYYRHLYLDRINWISILDYMAYEKDDAIKTLGTEAGWRPYEKKHYESVFTRFYQGYILPVKFNVDKRKVHYSTLICSGQMTREEALELMKKPAYADAALLAEDKKFVLKKLGFSEDEFREYLDSSAVPHAAYASSVKLYYRLQRIAALIQRLVDRFVPARNAGEDKKMKRWI
ncbi:MAG: N-acetyl sugar amidotransferase [Candidatus Margulisiibacteriota bacterium]